MKLLVLTAILAAVASNPVTQGQTWPWQVGKVYRYDANSYTTTNFDEGVKTGNAIKTQFIVSVKAAGHLQVKVENSQYASLKSSENNVEYQPIQNMDQVFDIFVDGGRVVSINFPSELSVVHENIIKSFISALQVDVSAFGYVEDYTNSYDHESFQGLFKKMEFDLVGECETLYSISPMSAEWRQELPSITSEEDPIEIIKTKNYGTCKKRMSYDFGVPEGAVWKGIAKGNDEKQFIQYMSTARVIVGKQGTIYKSEISSYVLASPVLFGQQKAEVKSIVNVYFKSVDEDNTAEWKQSTDIRSVESLMFTLDKSWRLFTYAGEQNVAKAQKILQEISPMLENPDSLEKGNFLMKFNVLVYLLMSINSEQLAQLTASIEVARTSKNVAKNGMWVVYRDAVAQCGTARAFDEIKSWVLTKKIEGDEAAQVISAFGPMMSQPSKSVLTDFFNLAISPEVVEQKSLNSSALLTVSRLLRLNKQEQLIVDTVIPYFSKELKQAIDNGDYNKAQVYVIVLGNLAHPGVLKVFAPYLEGQVTVTKYLRTQMVTSLKTLANLKDKYVRSVLFSILKNTAEPYEVRVAAALNIFLAVPTAEMMQVMAQMTNDDPSTQVRAVLTTSIPFAANLKEPRFAELAKTAQSVKHLISKEKYGYSYSTDSLFDGYTGDEDFSFFRELSYIGSEDSLLPKYHRAALRFKGTGFSDEKQMTLSISDVLDIVNNRASLFFATQNKADSTFKFTASQIVEMLNIKLAAHEPLQGAIFMENFNQQKLITFTETELFAFLKNVFDSNTELYTGTGHRFTKILRQNMVNVDFPLANGMPFTYQYSEPMIVDAQGKFKLAVDEQTLIGSLESDIKFTYSRNIVGTVGFMDTIGEVLVGAGVINKLQVHVPAKVKTSYQIGGELTVQIEPLHTDDDIKMVHMSVLPYIGTQKKNSIEYNLNVIERSSKSLVSTDFSFGHMTGMYYTVKGRSYSSDFKDIETTFDADLLSNLGYMLYQKDIALTEFNLKYLKDSPTKTATFTLFFDKLFNQKNSGEMGPATLTENLEPNSTPRREEIAKKVSSGIDEAEVKLVDISAVFDGQKKYDYFFTGAYAFSFVDPKVQAAFIARGNKQISAVFKLNKEGVNIAPLNFEQALENQIKVTYDADVKFENDMSMQVQGFGVRSEEYTQMLKNDPTAKFCLKDVKSQNLYTKDCHKMIIKAHAPDYFKATVTYNGGETGFWQTANIFKYLADAFSWENEFDPFVKSASNKVEIEAQAFYLDSYVNYNLTTPYGLVNFENIEGMWFYPYAMSMYVPINAWERSRNCYTGYQYMPYCAVDDNMVRTFSGRSYSYELTSSWHVVMVDSSAFKDLVILARRSNDNEEEVYVSYKSETDKKVELQIKPNSVEVKSNAVKTSDGVFTMYLDDTKYLQAPLLEYYTLAEGVQVFNLQDKHLRLVYDHQRLIIFTDEFRSTTRGICGQSSGQAGDDYLTPWGFVSRPDHYGASFSLDGEFSDAKTVELKAEAKLKAYQPVTKYTKILSADADWSKTINRTVKSSVV